MSDATAPIARPTEAAPSAALPGRPALALPAVLELTAAENLHRALLGHIQYDGPLEIDGSAVERVSTACLQILVAAANAARAHDVPFQLLAPSAVLCGAAQSLGLAGHLGLEVL